MNKEFSHEKSIRALEKNAKNGNFHSALELSSNYEKGRFVDKDIENSEKYKKLAYDIFKKQNLKLKKIKINNFRLFNEISINDFDDNLNIFIGNNGAGKTTILDAIELSLSWLSISINKNGGSGGYIEESDINFYTSIPFSTVTSFIEINSKVKASLELSQSKSGIVKTKNKLHEFKSVGDFYKTANNFDENFNMPLLSYYNIMRSYDVNPKDFKGLDDLSVDSMSDKFDGYQKSLTGKTDFRAFIKWYKKLMTY